MLVAIIAVTVLSYLVIIRIVLVGSLLSLIHI